MTYKLGRLLIQNFKAISNTREFNLSDCRAAILDGPNGFGKTTIFDALEICFTGKIERINGSGVYSNIRARDTHFLKNCHTDITVIKLELLEADFEKTFVIKVEIGSNISGAAASIKRYAEHIHRTTASTWDSPTWTPLNNISLGENLKIKNIATLFNVQHYISQEDTVHFLRNHDESKRHQSLSHLFGTSERSEEREQIQAIKEQLAAKVEFLKQSISNTQGELKAISTTNIGNIDKVEILPSQAIIFIAKLADEKNISLVALESALISLEGLVLAINHPQVYASLRFNKILDVLTNSRDQELDNLLKFGFSNDSTVIEKLNRARRRLEKHLGNLARNHAIQALVDSDDGNLSDDLLLRIALLYDKTKEFNTEIESLSKLRSQSSDYEKIIQKIRTHREKLLIAYQNYRNHAHSDQVECPMCGHSKEDGIEQLLSEYHRQEEFYVNETSTFSIEIAELVKFLKDSLIVPAKNYAMRHVSKLSWLEKDSTQEFFNKKTIDQSAFIKMDNVRRWLDENEIIYLDLIDEKLFIFSDDYFEKTVLLKERIQDKKHLVLDSEVLDMETIQKSRAALEIRNDFELQKISISAIKKDIEFVKQAIMSFRSKESHRLTSAIQVGTKALDFLKNKIASIDVILKIYNDKIRQYEIDVASCIAIPFYVYTSKVLQTRLDGSGIFLKTPNGTKEKNPYIRFCARRKDSHDAWCTMSSGQLAGLVISFALAMNRLYPSALKTIFIDDPVQSMDEINVASLIQLFLYEFPQHQFLVSTHERDISSYMSYKFMHGGEKIERINMKTLSYQVA